MNKIIIFFVYLFTPAVVFAAASTTDDGVVLIDQKAAKKGKISGDDPGFPVTLSESGSYRLSSNLSAEGTAIEIAANHITLNLNGFRLKGDGTGQGVTDNGASLSGIAVSNGTITNFDDGINLRSSENNMVSKVRTINNFGHGMKIGVNSTVSGNASIGNGKNGFDILGDSIVTDNVAKGNGFNGIFSDGEGNTVTGNTASSNHGRGISLASGTVIGNTASNNNDDGISASGATLVNNTANLNKGNGFIIGCPSNLIGNTAVGNSSKNLELLDSVECNRDNNIAP